MRASDRLRERILRNLKVAMDRADPDVERVEFWAAALEGLSQPVPSYEAHDNAFLLPRQNAFADASKRRH